MVTSLLSSESSKQFRRDPRDFSRDGVLSPELLTTLLIYMVADGNRRGYQHLLEGFWDEARSFGLSLPTDDAVSAASFCTARHKITPEFLKDALQRFASSDLTKTFGESYRWHGRRVFAVDGTKLNLQRGEDLERAFGVPNKSRCPQALMSIMLDVCAKVPVDVQVSGYASNEREHLLSMLPSLERGDVIVLDRGYPSHEILREFEQDGLDYLLRVPSRNTFPVIAQLRAEGKDDAVLRLDPPRDGPREWKPLTVRVIRLVTHDGNESFYLTSLSKAKFSTEDLRELYHLRWEAEEFFKLFKSPYIGQGQFRSKSASGIEQEIYALVLFLTMARVVMATAARVNEVKAEELSQKATVLGVAEYVSRLFLATESDYALDQLNQLLWRICRHRYKRRPDRSYPRVSFRTRARWGPTGRCVG